MLTILNPSSDDRAAIQSAIDACADAGGGEVRLEGGSFTSGTLYLKSHVTLHITAGATLCASPRIADYATDTHFNRYVNETMLDRCFLYAEEAENVTVCGRGMIDGNAPAFPNPGSEGRPMLMRFLRCRDVRIADLRLHQAAGWTVAVLDSTDVRCRDLDIFNNTNYNGDGLDFDGTRNVWVTGCRIQGTDDNLCLQSSSRRYPVRNIHISDCHFSSICAGVRIGLKSVGEIADVTISNCTFENIWREGVKIECTEGGAIRNILTQNCTMRNVRRPIFVLLNNRLAEIGSSLGLTAMPVVGEISDIVFGNLVITDEPEEMAKTHLRFGNDLMGSPRFNGIRVDAAEGHPIDGLTLCNITYHALGSIQLADLPQEPYPPVADLRRTPGVRTAENYWPDWSRAACADIRNVRRLRLENLQFATRLPDERPLLLTEQVHTV